jgi:hypothetical protein
MKERQQVNRIWSDQIGVWSFEADGLKPPSLDNRQSKPAPQLVT